MRHPSKATWVRAMPDGGVVELLAIVDPLAAPPVWWSPDGATLDEPIADVADFGDSPAGRSARIFVIRVQGPDRNPTIEWVSEWIGRCLSGQAVLGGEVVANVHLMRVEVLNKNATCDLSLRVAAGDWTTQAIRSIEGGTRVGDRARSVSFTTIRETEEGTALVVVEDFHGQDRRVEAVLRDGRRFSESSGDIDTQQAFWTHDLRFHDLKPGEIDRFELRTRPFAAVAFRAVSLDRRGP